ncbi:hypothetical protein ACFQX6_67120 [Streptosporangium lutulentum]
MRAITDPLMLHAPTYDDRVEAETIHRHLTTITAAWANDYPIPATDTRRAALNALHEVDAYTVHGEHRDGHTIGLRELGARWQTTAQQCVQVAAASHDEQERVQLQQIARTAYELSQRLNVTVVRKAPERTSYRGPEEYLAASATLRDAYGEVTRTATVQRLHALEAGQRESTDVAIAYRATQRLEHAYERLATDSGADLAQTHEHLMGLSDTSYALLIALREQDYRDPDDRDFLLELIDLPLKYAVQMRESAGQPDLAEKITEALAARTGGPAPAEQAGAAVYGLRIEHTSEGTIVLGVQRTDKAIHKILDDGNFKFSRNKGFWFLPRTWRHSTRTYRVQELQRALKRDGHTFTLDNQEPTKPAVDEAPPVPLPQAEPYTDLGEAQRNWSNATSGYWEMEGTPAGKRMLPTMRNYTAEFRPEGRELGRLHDRARGHGLTGSAEQVTTRFTALFQAARRLQDTLTTQRYNAPSFLKHLALYVQYTEKLASRLIATAADPERWATVMASHLKTTQTARAAEMPALNALADTASAAAEPAAQPLFSTDSAAQETTEQETAPTTAQLGFPGSAAMRLGGSGTRSPDLQFDPQSALYHGPAAKRTRPSTISQHAPQKNTKGTYRMNVLRRCDGRSVHL